MCVSEHWGHCSHYFSASCPELLVTYCHNNNTQKACTEPQWLGSTTISLWLMSLHAGEATLPPGSLVGLSDPVVSWDVVF